MKQVFYNLISNAIKFSGMKDRPQIEMGSFSHKKGRIVYYIRDNGVGFDMRYYHKLFGIFQRLHSVDKFEGTGVGLSICRRIIKRHGGLIWAESEPGKNTTFYFTLKALSGHGRG